jgi:hypothetical protein
MFFDSRHAIYLFAATYIYIVERHMHCVPIEVRRGPRKDVGVDVPHEWRKGVMGRVPKKILYRIAAAGAAVLAILVL